MATHTLQFDPESSSSSSDDEDAPPPAKRVCPECEARRLAGEAQPHASQPPAITPSTLPPCEEDLLDGTAFVVPNASAPSPDSKTAEYVRSLMGKMRLGLEREVLQANTTFASNVMVNNGAAEALRNVSDLIKSDVNYIPYSSFADMLHRENQLSTLGGTDPMATLFLRHSNKELKTFDYVERHLEDMLEHVVRTTRDFAFSPAQRVVVGYWLSHFPFELHARVRAAGMAVRASHQVGLPPNTRPSLTVLNLPTGSGKTALAILMAMTEVCDPALWQGLTASWRERVWLSASIGETGLTNCVSLEDGVLARVVIAYVPAQLSNQWKYAADLVNDALHREKGYGFTIWTGQGATKTLTLAHKRANATGVPILWIVAHTPEAVMHTLRQSPFITFATKIYDECSTTQEPPANAPEARAVSTLILQATISRLSSDRNSIVAKLVLGGERFNLRNARHAAFMHMLTLPNWLTHMLSNDMARVMPRGIQRVGMKVHVQSLSGQMLNSDLTITSMDDLLKAAMTSAGGENTLNKEEYDHLLVQCVEILGTNSTREAAATDAAATVAPPAPPSTGGTDATGDGTSIHARLLAAKANAEAAAAALPAPAPKPHRHAPEEELAEWWSGHEERERVRKKRLAFGATTRLFGALAKAIDPANRAECPIGLDEIPPEHCGVLWCCSTCFDVRNRKYFRDKCPVCNQKFASCVMVATQAISAIDPIDVNATGAAPAPVPSTPSSAGDEAALREAFEALSATDRVFSGSMKAVVAAIDAFLRYKPMGARILLAFPCEGNREEHKTTMKTRETLKTSLAGRVHSIESIGTSARKTKETVDRFVSDAPTNQIILINTNDRDHSRSVEGIDLHTADLVLLRPDESTQSSTYVQAIGRMVRPQFRTYVPDGWGCTGEDDGEEEYGRPDKWVVLLEDAAPAEAGAAGAAEEDSSSEGEWEDIDAAQLVDVGPDEARALLAGA